MLIQIIIDLSQGVEVIQLQIQIGNRAGTQACSARMFAVKGFLTGANKVTRRVKRGKDEELRPPHPVCSVKGVNTIRPIKDAEILKGRGLLALSPGLSLR